MRRRREPHADPSLEQAAASLAGKLDAMTERLRATVDHLIDEEDAAARRQEEDERTDPPGGPA